MDTAYASPARAKRLEPAIDVQRKRFAGRDLLVVLAEPDQAPKLVTLLRAGQLDVITPRTPLDTLQILEREHHRVACVLLASKPEWALQLRPILDVDYPDIDQIALIV